MDNTTVDTVKELKGKSVNLNALYNVYLNCHKVWTEAAELGITGTISYSNMKQIVGNLSAKIINSDYTISETDIINSTIIFSVSGQAGISDYGIPVGTNTSLLTQSKKLYFPSILSRIGLNEIVQFTMINICNFDLILTGSTNCKITGINVLPSNTAGTYKLFKYSESVYFVMDTVSLGSSNTIIANTVYGDLNILGNLNMYNTNLNLNGSNLTGNIFIKGLLDMTGQKLSLNNANLSGNIIHNGNHTIIGNLNMTSTNLNLNNSNIIGEVAIVGNLNLNNANIVGNSRFLGTPIFYSNVSMLANLDMFNRILNLNGSNINGNTTQTGIMTIIGNMDLKNGNLNLNNSFLNGNININGYVSQTGNLKIIGNLDMIGQNLQLNNANIIGNTYQNGIMTINGNLDMFSKNLNLNGSNINGNTTQNGTLNMKGNLDILSGILNLNGSVINGNTTQNGNLNIKGNLDIFGGNLNLNGSFINGSINHNGNLTIAGNLNMLNRSLNLEGSTITGNTIFSNGITAKNIQIDLDGSTLKGNISTTGNISVSNTLDISGKLRVGTSNGSLLSLMKVGSNTISANVISHTETDSSVDVNSKVFITLTGNNPPNFRYCVLLQPGKFILSLTSLTESVMPFNYLIINN